MVSKLIAATHRIRLPRPGFGCQIHLFLARRRCATARPPSIPSSHCFHLRASSLRCCVAPFQFQGHHCSARARTHESCSSPNVDRMLLSSVAVQPMRRRIAARSRRTHQAKPIKLSATKSCLSKRITELHFRVRSSVDLSQYNIDGSDHGHHIGQHPALAHGFKRLQRRKRWIAHVYPVGLGRAV